MSRTVTDLVAGSGIQFDDRGQHELKGVPEPRSSTPSREPAVETAHRSRDLSPTGTVPTAALRRQTAMTIYLRTTRHVASWLRSPAHCCFRSASGEGDAVAPAAHWSSLVLSRPPSSDGARWLCGSDEVSSRPSVGTPPRLLSAATRHLAGQGLRAAAGDEAELLSRAPTTREPLGRLDPLPALMAAHARSVPRRLPEPPCLDGPSIACPPVHLCHAGDPA